MSDLGAIDADVEFDNAAADALISACRLAASAIELQAGPRAAYVATGRTDFKGHFSDLFTTNASTAAGDAGELGSRLLEVATGATRLKEEAAKEQQRRETARQWKKEQDDKAWYESAWDSAFGSDDPPVGPPAEPVSVAVSPSVNRARQNPQPGAGGGGAGGTSSARPENLRSFATGSQTANDELSATPAALKSKYSAFTARCHWGSLSAAGVFTGYDQWLAANDADVTWATTVADAFRAAGGEGAVSTVSDAALAAALAAKGVSASRADIVITAPQAFGAPPTTGYANDPVNTATGNFLETETDLSFGGSAGLLSFGRCYNSFDERAEEAFGPGWSSPAEAGLSFDAAAGMARFRLPDGREVHFPRLGEGWDRAPGENLWLERAGDDLQVCGNDGSWWRFDAAGRVLAYGIGAEDEDNWVRLERDATGRLAGLEHARGRSIVLTWGAVAGSDRIVAATASDGRRVTYGYDAGRLVTVTSALGTRTYRWGSPDDQDGPISTVIDADGVVAAENVYDEQRRVVRQRSPYGRVTRFAYLPERITVVSDEDGQRSNTWIADQRGRLIGVLDADDRRQSMSYDAHGNQVMTTERDGSVTVHEFDARGRKVRTVTPSGADLTYGYDDADRVTAVITEQGATTAYDYAGEQRNPSAITDPEGGITHLVWDRGLLREVIDPVGVTIRFGYDAHGELVTVTDADGNVAGTERDDTGRVVAAVTPSGRRSSYVYDETTGLLRARVDPAGASWAYEYTAAGRLSATVDPMGARTTIERGEHGDEVRTIDPLGRVVTRELGDLGEVTRVSLPNGSTWRFTHDATCRLTGTTDPTGAVWIQEYDSVGDLVASVDPTGVRSAGRADLAAGEVAIDHGDGDLTRRFDPLGRLTSVADLDGSAAMYVYDRCGRPVEALDADGGLTRITRDAAGRVVTSTSPLGATVSYSYDRCGRLVAVTDPLGARTAIGYDTDGRPVRQALPTGDVAWTRYDTCGRVVEHHQPGIGSARYGYDACGRVVEARDPGQGRRTFRYDLAGQLVEATDGNGGVTRYTYDEAGRAVEITTPVGGTIRREFDGMNRCVAETDPLGRTTRAGYDAAGRLTWQTDPDGHRTTWAYDAQGRPLSMAVDGRTLSTLVRDVRERRLVVTESTGAATVEHVLEWNRRGQLVRRSRGGRTTRWSYDADGRRTAMTTPDGITTSYTCDAAGRVNVIEHPDLGRAAFDRDAAGRIVAATAGGLLQSWEHRDGFVVAHSITDGEGSRRTRIERDETGRISGVVRDDIATSYRYDAANQLIATATRTGDEVSHAEWRYDVGGRLVTETRDGSRTRHAYDLAGQLLSSTADDEVTDYSYDGLGRRVCSSVNGNRREFRWSLSGHLAAVIDRRGDRTSIEVDALGELAAVDGTEYVWDTAAYAGTPVLVGDVAVVAAGAVTGIGTDWTAPGWRTARSSSSDPWSSAAGQSPVGPSGEVSVAGLEWMAARVYDPGSRGFLSVDPLESVTAAGWSANPYAFAGNDPLHALDPRGLRPVTDAELQAYKDSNNGFVSNAAHAVGGWMKDNWEYVAGGAAILAGGVLMATGVGGPLGAMLISGGLDVVVQKATTGKVNWGEAAVSFGTGALGGGAMAAKFGLQGAKAAVVAGAASGAGSGAIMSGYQYATGPGPHTAGGFIGATAQGAGSGAVFGGAGGAAGYRAANALRGITSHGTAGHLLDDVSPTPSVPDPTPPPNGYLYRGVHADHPGYQDALNGTARPWGGHSDPALHNAGDNRSEFTSWTTDQTVTERFLQQSQGQGAVLRIPNEDGPGYTRVFSPDSYNEKEVLIQGTVHGAEVLQ